MSKPRAETIAGEHTSSQTVNWPTIAGEHRSWQRFVGNARAVMGWSAAGADLASMVIEGLRMYFQLIYRIIEGLRVYLQDRKRTEHIR